MISKLLRQHTASLHDRVERSVNLPARCRTLGSYRGLIGRLLGLYEPLEQTLACVDWAPLGIEFEPRRKAALLLADLWALNLPPGMIVTLPVCESLPRLPTPAAALGCMYVLEGATLGGRVIAQRARKTLAIEPSTGGSFYVAYGAETTQMWRSFCAAADGYCGKSSAKVADALAAAVTTFETFERWIGTESAG